MLKLKEVARFLAELRHGLERASEAARDNGVSLPRQLGEMILLRAGPGRLLPTDYYRLRVYRRDRTLDEKRCYVSPLAFGAMARDRRWGIVADDKLLTYAILMSQGIQIPEVPAIVHPMRSFATARALRSAAELEAYLTAEATYPFFAKPIQGIYSKGSALVQSLDRERASLLLGDGSEMPLQSFVRECCEKAKGFLLQELLHPHADVAEVCGDRLCTVRMIVLVDGQGARVYDAFWKIAAPGNMADNYWRKGNMLALLDRERGTVKRCTTGLGADLREVDKHPATGRPLIGFQLPDWSAIVAVTLKAAQALPGLPVQAWDIAVTSKGPVPLEVNIFGSPFIPQIANDAGLLQGEFRSFLEAHRG